MSLRSVIKSGALVCGIVSVLNLVGSATANSRASEISNIHNVGFSLVSAAPKTLKRSVIARAENGVTRGVVAYGGKAISFPERSINLVIQTGPSSDMLSYRINGLRNPKLVVNRGATLHILFVNDDDDMFHNIRFGALSAGAMQNTSKLEAQSVGLKPLMHVNGGILHGASMVIKAPNLPGTYAYFCTVRGHAPGGMWGSVQVR